MEKTIDRIIDFIIRYNKLVIFNALVIILLSAYIASNLEIDSNFKNMMPENNEIIRIIDEMEEEFGSQDSIIVAVEGNDPVLIKDFMEELLIKVKEEQIANSVYYKIDFMDESHYFKSDDDTMYLMMIVPKISLEQFMVDREEFFSKLFNVVNEIKNNPKYTSLDCGVTGGTLIQDYEGDNVLTKGLAVSTIITLIIILLIFALSFRRIILPLSTIMPLMMGIVLTSAIAFLLFKSLNLLSVSFTVLLLGMGIDYAIHILSRYTEERNKGNNLADSLKITIKCTGKAMFIGTLTTAIAFTSFLFAELRAFTQMGVISSIGIFLALISQLILTPALIAALDKKRANKKVMEYEFLRPMGRILIKKKVLTIAIFVLVIATLSFNVVKINISGDLSKLYPNHIQSTQWLKRVQEKFDYNPDEIIMMANDIEDLESITISLNELESVKSTESIIDFLPDNKNLWQAYILMMPDEVKSNFIGKSGKYLIKVIPDIDMDNKLQVERFYSNIREISPYVSGMPVITYELINIVIKDAVRISLLTLLFIFIILMVTYRNMVISMINITIIVSSLYIMFGIMPILSITLTITSVAALPLIIGIGIDGVIHITHRIRTSGKTLDSLVHTGKAVIISTLTTIVGFSSLMFSNHPALIGLGQITTMGLAINMMLTLMMLPVLLKMMNRKSKIYNEI